MTYGLGIRLAAGLVMIADTRTNAGLDNISVYRKLHVLAEGGDRLVLAATAGNLSVCQEVLGVLAEGLPGEDETDRPRSIGAMPSMFRVAELVAEAVRRVNAELRPALERAGVNGIISLLVGGRIGDGVPELFLIYDAGNFIRCEPDTPFLQVGATAYGKPILDRALRYDSSLAEAVKIALLSFDATVRSDLAVGAPFDLVVLPADPTRPVIRRRIAADDPYFHELSARWEQALADARAAIPAPPFVE